MPRPKPSNKPSSDEPPSSALTTPISSMAQLNRVFAIDLSTCPRLVSTQSASCRHLASSDLTDPCPSASDSPWDTSLIDPKGLLFCLFAGKNQCVDAEGLERR